MTTTHSTDTEVVAVPVRELRRGDKIPRGTPLGNFIQTTDHIIISRTHEAEGGRIGLALNRIGTIYLPPNMYLPVFADRPDIETEGAATNG